MARALVSLLVPALRSLALIAAAVELVGLLGATGTRPSLNSVLGGVAAIIVGELDAPCDRTVMGDARSTVDLL